MAPLPRNGPQCSGLSANTMLGFSPPSFPPRKRGPRNRGGAAAAERTSAQWAFRQHDARVLLKTSTLRASEPLAVRCPLGCHPASRGPWLPAFAGKTRISFPRAPSSFPPRKRGPRSRGGAAATERTSVQRTFSQHDARVLAPFVSPAEAGAQEPRWRRCCGTDLSAVGFPTTRCSGSFENQHAPCLGAFGGPMPSWLPPSVPWPLAPGVRRENENKLPPRSFFVSPAKAGAQEPRWCRCHSTDLSAASFPPARCAGSRPFRFPRESGGLGAAVVPLPQHGPQRSELSVGTMLGVLLKSQHPPCRGDRGGSMSFWPPPSAPWSLDPGVRRENDERDRRQTRPLSRFSDFRHAFYVSSALSLVSPAKAGA